MVNQIRGIGKDPALIASTIDEANKAAREEVQRLDEERALLKRDVSVWTKELPTVSANRQADLHERLAAAERRATELHEARAAVVVIAPEQVQAALAQFDDVWATLTPQEQTRVVELLVSRIDYDGRTGRIVVAFNLAGIVNLGVAA